MQFTQVFALLAFTAAGAMAAPNANYAPPPPPKPYVPAPPTKPTHAPPPPPVINNQANSCSSGSPFCCSPSSTGPGTTCQIGQTQCNSVSICCNNFNGLQTCTGTGALQQPVEYKY